MSDIEFEKYLKDDEHILWSHIPEKGDRKIQPFPLICGIIILAAAIINFIVETGDARYYGSSIIGIVAMMFMSNCIERKDTYVVTDKRVMAFRGRRYHAMPLEWIRFTCSFEMNNDGIGMVEVGRHLSDKNGIVFRNIKDPGYVERIIRENAKLHE
jgi:hypothetical protein